MAPRIGGAMVPFRFTVIIPLIAFFIIGTHAQAAQTLIENHWMVDEAHLQENYGKVDEEFGLSYATGKGSYVYDPRLVAPHFDYPTYQSSNRIRVINHDGYLIFKNQVEIFFEYGHCMQKPNGAVLSCFCYLSSVARTNKLCGNAVASSICITGPKEYKIDEGAANTITGDKLLSIKIDKSGAITGVTGAPNAKIERIAWFAAAGEIPLAVRLVSPYPPKSFSDNIAPCSSLVFDAEKATFIGELAGGQLKSSNVHSVAFQGTVSSNIKKPNCDRRKKYCEKVCDEQKDAGVEAQESGSAGVCRRRVAKNIFLGASAVYAGQRVWQ